MATNRRAQRTRRQVETLRALGRAKKPRKTLPRQIRPAAIERDYARALVRIANRTRDALRPLMRRLPALLRSARAEILRLDAPLREDAGEANELRQLIAEALATAQLADPDLDQLARLFAARTATYQRIQMQRQVRAVLGVDVFAADPPAFTAAVESFAAENVGLMADLPRKTFAEIEGIVVRGASAGRLHTDVAKEINERLRVQKNRAKLIARDQVGKFYSSVTTTRHMALGVTHFFWHTVGDERVRPEHAAIHGDRFKYPDGHATEGLPGQPILCRCFPDPDFSNLLG